MHLGCARRVCCFGGRQLLLLLLLLDCLQQMRGRLPSHCCCPFNGSRRPCCASLHPRP
jgi:hypothetical protein